jgi:hypothetical protein
MFIALSRRFPFLLLLAGVLCSLPGTSPAQTPEQGGATSTQDAGKRLQWLKSMGLNAPPPTPSPAPVRKRFAETRNPALRSHESTTPAGGANGSDKTLAGNAAAGSTPKNTPGAPSRTPTPKHTTPSAVASAADAAKSPARIPAPVVQTKVAATHGAVAAAGDGAEASAKPAAKATPPGGSAPTGPHSPKVAVTSIVTPSPKPSPSGPPEEITSRTKQSTELRITDIHPATRPESVASRYPWKTRIVTTIFWIGEPVGGNNYTPNCASSWDSNWTRSYGGYDNPNPVARRNYLPVSFTPRQNPFYVALPYNDVTRGTTKPEARLVIPWFREAFRREGLSVCRDRWVAVRSRAGRVAYAQWSDCGPFRTDHWQYVFGMEKPRPNLNGGAGLDVSPAMRDYLGLQSTDVTDWKFIDARDVPSGPWLLYGDNNPFAQKRYHVTRTAAERESGAVTQVARR